MVSVQQEIPGFSGTNGFNLPSDQVRCWRNRVGRLARQARRGCADHDLRVGALRWSDADAEQTQVRSLPIEFAVFDSSGGDLSARHFGASAHGTNLDESGREFAREPSILSPEA